MAQRSFASVASAAFGALLVAMWLGCGSSTETTPGAEPEDEDDTRSTDETPPKPAFEAGFEEEEDGGTGPGTDGGVDVEAGPGCSDPNDAPASVGTALPPTDDCNESLLGLTGVAASSVDVDLYTLSATDKFGCGLDTTFNLETSKIEMCVFLQCKVATVDAVSGCAQGTLATDPQTSLEGCCRTTPGAVVPQWDCDGFTDDDSATFFIRVKANPGAPACQSYSVRYRF